MDVRPRVGGAIQSMHFTGWREGHQGPVAVRHRPAALCGSSWRRAQGGRGRRARSAGQCRRRAGALRSRWWRHSWSARRRRSCASRHSCRLPPASPRPKPTISTQELNLSFTRVDGAHLRPRLVPATGGGQHRRGRHHPADHHRQRESHPLPVRCAGVRAAEVPARGRRRAQQPGGDPAAGRDRIPLEGPRGFHGQRAGSQLRHHPRPRGDRQSRRLHLAGHVRADAPVRFGSPSMRCCCPMKPS